MQESGTVQGTPVEEGAEKMVAGVDEGDGEVVGEGGGEGTAAAVGEGSVGVVCIMIRMR